MTGRKFREGAGWMVNGRPPEAIAQGTRYGHDPYMGPASLTDVRPWADEAACKDVPHIFDAADGAKVSSPRVARAKAVCAGCPALQACLDETMVDESGSWQHRYSVRGGLTPQERAALWAERTNGQNVTP